MGRRFEKPDQKPGSMLATGIRSYRVWGDLPRGVEPGLARVVQHCQAQRITEVRALESLETQPRLTMLQSEVYRLEQQRGVTKRDKDGKIIQRAIGGNALWDWIAGQLRKRGYPDLTVSAVKDILQDVENKLSFVEALRIA